MAVFDAIARQYAELNAKRVLYDLLIYPSFYGLIGDVCEQTVLDLATGDGHVAREMDRRGARLVVGVDESNEMLKIAMKDGTAVDYRYGIVGTLGRLDDYEPFDIVTGSFLLHYAHNKGTLRCMCEDIAVNLKPGGVFYGINNNPFHPVGGDPKFQNTVTCDDPPLREGSRLTVRFDGTDVSFPNYHWNWSTYERVLFEAGLIPDFIQMRPTAEAVKTFGEEFWHPFLSAPTLIMIRAVKR